MIEGTMRLNSKGGLRSLLTRVNPVFFLAIFTLLSFQVRDLQALVITEIMYNTGRENPDGTEDQRYEFIEIYNENHDPIDLSGFYFSSGIFYEFPAQTILAGRTYLVIAADPDTIEAEYGISGVLGPWSSTRALSNSGEKVALANSTGRELVEVTYNDKGKWTAAADGTRHSLSIFDPFFEVDDPDSWGPSAQLGGTPGASNFGTDLNIIDTPLIPSGSVWKYFKGTENPPSAWKEASFDDGGWLEGPTGIGYGDGDDATVLSDMEDNYLSVFCRRKFTVDDLDSVDILNLTVTYDDSFHAYLNGERVASVNIGTNETNFDDNADDAGEPETTDLNLSSFKHLLVEGAENILAVSVHNANLGSSDLSFIPRLTNRRIVEPEVFGTVPVRINEGYFPSTGDRWIELYNTSDSEVDIGGFYLTDDKQDLTKTQLAEGVVIPARGWIAFTDVELGLNFSLQDPVVRDEVYIALVNASGSRVIDAFAFSPELEGKSEARMPDGDEDVAPAAEPTRAAQNEVDVITDVVINEIMYHPLHQGENEYIEIFNRGDVAVDLTGWKLRKGIRFDFPPGSFIGSGEYVVIARSPARINQIYGPAVKTFGPDTPEGRDDFGGLRNSGERINLRDENGNLADTVRFHDGGYWPRWADGGGSSIELIDPWADNNVGSSWDASDDSRKANTTLVSYNSRHAGGEPEIQIALLDRGIAIVDNLSVKAGANERLSNGHFNSSESGWAIEGNHIWSGRTTKATERLDGNGSLKLIATGRGDNKVNRLESATQSLSTSTTYTISYEARWVVGANAVLTRGYDHGLAKRNFLPVPLNLGTPGNINSVSQRQIDRTGSTNLGPTIDKVRQNPVVPEASESVTVSAKISDPDGIQANSVRLFYALNSKTANFTQVAMSGPDNDGRYSAVIPGQSSGTRVLYYIVADDTENEEGRFPTDANLRTHPTLVDPDNATNRDRFFAIYRHDTRLPSGNYHSYRFVLNQTDEDYLWTRRVLSNDFVDGSFVFGADRMYYNSKVRFSGSPWLRPNGGWNRSYRVNLPKHQPLHGAIRSFNMENHGTDGRERLSHHLIRYNNRDGIPAPYTIPWYVRWQMNNRVDRTYEHVPKPDSSYLGFWFPRDDNGEFFEIDDRFEFNDSGGRVSNRDARLTFPPYSNSIYHPGDPENYRWYFNTRARRAEDNYSGLISLASVLDPSRTNTSTFDNQIEDTVNLDGFLRVWAIRMNTDDWDTWGTNRGKNAYVYFAPIEGRWHLFPWDLELTYGNVNAFALPSNPNSSYNPGGGKFPEVNRLINRPQIKRRFWGILKEMVDSQFHSQFLSQWRSMSQAAGTGNLGAAGSNGFIDQRRSRILTTVDSVSYPDQRLTISTNSGNDIETSNLTVNLSGQAPVEVTTIRVLNQGLFLVPEPETQFSRSSLLGWSLDNVPLVPGENELQVIGFNSAGDVVDTDTIDVTSTASWDPPVIFNVDPNAGAEGEGITITGSSFRTGLKVFFGTTEATDVDFDPSVPAQIEVEIPEGLALGDIDIKVVNLDDQESAHWNFQVTLVLPKFIRGDANLNGKVELGDAVTVLVHAFRGQEVGCRQALDVDDNGSIESTDAIRILTFIYSDGSAPSAPFPSKGVDSTADDLDCMQGI